ncbi:acyl-CoA thioesterase [Myceligenerans xiligouense]|nr:acyl-CoA thioesterase [Myceligenerans xiligouense]
MTRMLQLAWTGVFPRKQVPDRSLLDPSVYPMRVLPQDLDLLMHVNNGSYLQLMDVARFRHVAEMGGTALGRQKQFGAVVAASTMKYRRSLKLFDRFELTTRVLGWDERCFYMEQVFTRREKLCARGVVATRFLHSRTNDRIMPATVVELLAEAHGLASPPESPALPDDVAAWARVVDVAPRGRVTV